jgi:hypothetical protein
MDIKKGVVGVDPGGTGAGVMLYASEIVVHDWVGPKEAFNWLCDMCLYYPVALVCIEKVHAISYVVTDMNTGLKKRMSQKGTINFNFGENYGYWQMAAIAATGRSPILVSPQTWQAGLPMQKKSVNDKPGFEIARRLYPAAPLQFKSKHHNRADALLIARWGENELKKGVYV